MTKIPAGEYTVHTDSDGVPYNIEGTDDVGKTLTVTLIVTGDWLTVRLEGDRKIRFPLTLVRPLIGRSAESK